MASGEDAEDGEVPDEDQEADEVASGEDEEDGEVPDEDREADEVASGEDAEDGEVLDEDQEADEVASGEDAEDGEVPDEDQEADAVASCDDEQPLGEDADEDEEAGGVGNENESQEDSGYEEHGASALLFTRGGDSGCVYYVKIKLPDERGVMEAPIGIHRGVYNESLSCASDIAKSLKSLDKMGFNLWFTIEDEDVVTVTQ